MKGGNPVRGNLIRRILILVMLIYFSIFIIFPLLGMFNGAFENGVQSFWFELTKLEALNAFKLTFFITFIVTVVNIVVGTALAILLVRFKFPGRSILNGIIDLPFSISPIVAGFMLVLLYGPQGLLGVFFGEFDVRVIFAVPGMVLATLFVTLPFIVREVSLVLEAIGREEEEAAVLLGASDWQVFCKVTLPGIKWGLLYGISLTIARSLGEFGAVLVVSGNVINITQTAPLHIYQAYVDYNYYGAYAVSTILAIVSFSLLYGMEIIKRRQREVL